MLGSKVRTLVNEVQDAGLEMFCGMQLMIMDPVSAGMYIYTRQAPFIKQRKYFIEII